MRALGLGVVLLRYPPLFALIALGMAGSARATDDPSGPVGQAAATTPLADSRAAASHPARPLLRSLPPAKPLVEDGACRDQCAQQYYFCAAADAEDACAAAWSQCSATCDAPNLGRVGIGLPP